MRCFVRVSSVLLTVLILPLLLSAGCAPPLRLEKKGTCVIADVQRLGEYYTIVNQLELREKRTGRVIWSARAKAGAKPQLHYLQFCAGRNPLIPNVRGDTNLLNFGLAESGGSFYLIPGEEYLLEVESPGYTRRASKSFVLEGTPDKG